MLQHVQTMRNASLVSVAASRIIETLSMHSSGSMRTARMVLAPPLPHASFAATGVPPLSPRWSHSMGGGPGLVPRFVPMAGRRRLTTGESIGLTASSSKGGPGAVDEGAGQPGPATTAAAAGAAASRRGRPRRTDEDVSPLIPDRIPSSMASTSTASAPPPPPAPASRAAPLPPPIPEEPPSEAAVLRAAAAAQAHWGPILDRLDRPGALRLRPQLSFDSSPLGLSPERSKGIPIVADFLRWKCVHYDKVVLARVGDFYEACGVDAVALVQWAGLNPMAGRARAGCPAGNIRGTLRQLVHAGLSVVVVEESREFVHGKSKRDKKQRIVSDTVTPARPFYQGVDIFAEDWGGGPSEFGDGPGDLAPVVLGLATRAGGYMAIEVNLDVLTVEVSEGLTAEAVSARVHRGGLSPPVYLHESLERGQRAASGGRWGALGGGGQHDWHTVVRAALRSYTDQVRTYSGPDPVTALVDRVTLDQGIGGGGGGRGEALSSGDETGLPGTSSQAGAFSVVRREPGLRPRPLYLSTASQLGIERAPGVPSLVEALLPKEAPAAHRRLLRQLLLVPPDYKTADGIRDAIRGLSQATAPLPALRPLAPSRVALLLSSAPSSAASIHLLTDVQELCRDISALCGAKAAQSPGPGPALAAHLMPAVVEATGLQGTTAAELGAHCDRALSILSPVLGAPDSWLMGDSGGSDAGSSGHPVAYYSGAAPSAFSPPYGSSLDALEAAVAEAWAVWQGGSAAVASPLARPLAVPSSAAASSSVDPEAEEEDAAGVEGSASDGSSRPPYLVSRTAAANFLCGSESGLRSDPVPSDSWTAGTGPGDKPDDPPAGYRLPGPPLLSSPSFLKKLAAVEAAGLAVLDQATAVFRVLIEQGRNASGPYSTPPPPFLSFSGLDESLWLLFKAASGTGKAKPPNAEVMRLLGLEKARDRYGAEEKLRFVTAGLASAQQAYRRACFDAEREMDRELRRCAEALRPLVRPLQAATYMALLLGALKGHAREGTRRGWTEAEMEPLGEALLGGEGGRELGPRPEGQILRAEGLFPYWMGAPGRPGETVRDPKTVSNSFDMGGLFVLTGANMTGKSTVLRATCAAGLLANCGLLVPAARLSCPRLDSAVFRNFAADDVLEGRSSFASEMAQMKEVLAASTSRSLILLDELGRGTTLEGGAAIAGAVLEELSRARPLGVFATHLHVLFSLPLDRPNTEEWAMGLREEPPGSGVRAPTHRMAPGRSTQSLTLQVAEAYGVPAHVVSRASELYTLLENKNMEEKAGNSWEAASAPVPPTPEPEVEPRPGIASGMAVPPPPLQPPPPPPPRPPRVQLPSKSLSEAALVLRDIVRTVTGDGDPHVVLIESDGMEPPPSVAERACVYVVRRPSDGRFYVGESDKLHRRLQEHRTRAPIKGGPGLQAAYYVLSDGRGDGAPAEGGKSRARRLERVLILTLEDKGFPLISSSDARNRAFGDGGGGNGRGSGNGGGVSAADSSD